MLKKKHIINFPKGYFSDDKENNAKFNQKIYPYGKSPNPQGVFNIETAGGKNPGTV